MFDQRGQQVGNQNNESAFPIKWDEMVSKPRLQELVDKWRERAAFAYGLGMDEARDLGVVINTMVSELQEILGK